MPGASAETRRVRYVNANWRPADDGGDGRFELLVITDDDQRFATTLSPAALTAVVAMADADCVFAWDPTNHTLISANIVGQMPWTVEATNR
jgi:hypothetical protein